MVTKLLGIGIIAGEEVGELWRWIGKAWKLDFAIQATFAEHDMVSGRPAETLIPSMQSTTKRAGYIHST